MLAQLIQPELEEMIRAGRFSELRSVLTDLETPDIAELIADLPPEDTAPLFRILPRQKAAEVYEQLPLPVQQALLKAMGQEHIARILNDMAPDERTALLEELPAEAARQFLALLSPEEYATARKLLGYPEESIGRLMTPDCLALRESWNVAEALDYIRKHGQDSETLNVLYVVDGDGRLIDDIRSRELLLSPVDRPLSELMDRQVVALRASDDQETAVGMFRKYERVALPVTDSEGTLLGIVTIDDVLHVVEEEATEDIQKIGGMQALDLPYFATGLPTMIRKRAGWLIVLFLGEMLTATAMGHFEAEIAKAVVLTLFVPLIISSGGNSGSQATSLIIRALSLGEVAIGDWWRIMRREIVSGLALGGLLGGIGFLRICIWSLISISRGHVPLYGEHWLLIALTIWTALIGVVLWGTLAGALLPLLMKRIGADPAASSAPFVATLVDVTGLVIYFSAASVFLRGTLL